jgi:hypothetical protein
MGDYHDLGHISIFAALTFIVSMAEMRLHRRTLSVALVALLAVLLEYLQHVFYGDPFEYRDVASDLTGMALGLAFALLIPRRKQL